MTSIISRAAPCLDEWFPSTFGYVLGCCFTVKTLVGFEYMFSLLYHSSGIEMACFTKLFADAFICIEASAIRTKTPFLTF